MAKIFADIGKENQNSFFLFSRPLLLAVPGLGARVNRLAYFPSTFYNIQPVSTKIDLFRILQRLYTYSIKIDSWMRNNICCPSRTHGGGGTSSSPTGWREARTEALDLVCLMNNSVKAKAAEASLVRTVNCALVSSLILHQMPAGETAEEVAKCFHRSLLLQRCVTSAWGLQVSSTSGQFQL